MNKNQGDQYIAIARQFFSRKKHSCLAIMNVDWDKETKKSGCYRQLYSAIRLTQNLDESINPTL